MEHVLHVLCMHASLILKASGRELQPKEISSSTRKLNPTVVLYLSVITQEKADRLH